MNTIDDGTLEAFKALLYEHTGLVIGESKKLMLHNKLVRIMKQKDITSPNDYLRLLQHPNSAEQRQDFINHMTTNTTEFFREKHHFDFVAQNIDFICQQNPRINRSQSIRVWCTSCSTGQEPITLAMVLKATLGEGFAIRILATDINSRVLHSAVSGIYPKNECRVLPAYYLQKWFTRQGEDWAVNKEILQLIKYRWFNLMDPFPFNSQFDMIWCRNTLIYFNSQVQQQLIDKFSRQLVGGGLLFLGHSESLINKRHSLYSVGHSIYIKLDKGSCL